jgi:amyloid beta precursor protein binding protein 1
LESIGRPTTALSPADIRHFCRHARYLRLLRCPPLASAQPPTGAQADALRAALASEDATTNATLWVLLRAADRFAATNHRYPGTIEGDVDDDVAVLKQIASAMAAESGAPGAALSDDLVGEVCRFGAGEMHAVAAVVGAMASQEAIKLVTRQFVPLKGTLVYNAMHCTTSVFGF